MAIILLLLLPAIASGQSIRAFEMRLGDTSATGARIEVREMDGAATLTGSLPSGNGQRSVGGWRVEIFSDNSANARALAYEAYARFRELHPEVPSDSGTDISYDSPKYTVRVGRFLTRDEALMMCGRLKGEFTAYPRSEQFPLSLFGGPEPDQTQYTAPASETNR